LRLRVSAVFFCCDISPLRGFLPLFRPCVYYKNSIPSGLVCTWNCEVKTGGNIGVPAMNKHFDNPEGMSIF
jgi:hypothetical protein